MTNKCLSNYVVLQIKCLNKEKECHMATKIETTKFERKTKKKSVEIEMSEEDNLLEYYNINSDVHQSVIG